MPYRPTMMNARLILTEEPIHSAASTLTDPLARAGPKPQDQVACKASHGTGGGNREGNCGSVGLADRRLAVLAHYSPPKQCLKLFFFPLPCLLASRLLQWRLLRHAAMQATTATATALPGAQWPTDAPWTPMQ